MGEAAMPADKVGTQSAAAQRSIFGAFGGGARIGALGGLIGLGRAEFRGGFRFVALEAVILNNAMCLVVVAWRSR